jgi:hypothetical protein
VFVNNPVVGDAYRFPIPSKNIRPTAEKTLVLLKPDTRLPIEVVLKLVVVVPVVP